MVKLEMPKDKEKLWMGPPRNMGEPSEKPKKIKNK